MHNYHANFWITIICMNKRKLTHAVGRFFPSMRAHPEVCLCCVSQLLGQYHQMLGCQGMCLRGQWLPLHIQLGIDVLVQQSQIIH